MIQELQKLPGTSKTTDELISFLAWFYKSYEKFSDSNKPIQSKKFEEMVGALNRIAKCAKVPSVDWQQESLLAKVFSSTGDAQTVINNFYFIYRVGSWGNENDVIQIAEILQHPLMKL